MCSGYDQTSCGAVAWDVFSNGSAVDITNSIVVTDATECLSASYNSTTCPDCTLEALSLLPNNQPSTPCLPGIYTFNYQVRGFTHYHVPGTMSILLSTK